jgi:hypothetical protein
LRREDRVQTASILHAKPILIWALDVESDTNSNQRLGIEVGPKIAIHSILGFDLLKKVVKVVRITRRRMHVDHCVPPMPCVRKSLGVKLHLADFFGFAIFGQHHMKLAGIGELDEPIVKVSFSFVSEYITYPVAVGPQSVSRNELTLFQINILPVLL